MLFSRFTKFAAMVALLLAGLPVARGFTPIGPLTTWMDNGTLPEYPGSPGGGPMNINEAYRWNVPVIYYAFDPSFVSYFGTNGINAVEGAIKILNDLPAASALDINKYPLYSTRINYRASSLLLQDVKSWTLESLLEAIGLAGPERYVFCVRNMTHDGAGNPYFTVIKRNFDPDTGLPSSYVNGVFYTYFIRYTTPDSPAGETATAVEVPVDPLSRTFTTVASQPSLTGEFYTGLTRDDVGAIKYIYSKSRRVVETATNVTSVTGITVAGGDSSGWQVALNTNITDIGSIDTTVLVGSSSGWYSLNITNTTTSTNTTGSTTGGTDTGGVTTTTTNAYVSTALRPGVDKLTFVRLNYDSVYGFFRPMTNIYVDTYITNNIVRRQVLQRGVAIPDLTFLSADLGMDNNAPQTPINSFATGPTGWYLNEGANNTIDAGVPNGTFDGPGTIPAGGYELWFSRLGPNYFNGLSYLNEATATPGAGGIFMWGSFDGSTNEPIAYPSGTSLKEIEAIINGY